jgi:SAM-dependent methyltransferase
MGKRWGNERTEPAEPIDLRGAWEEQAEAWTRWARAPLHDSYWRFGRPAFFELLPVPGRLTLDVGCGEGRVSRDLEALGHRVLEIDASRKMIEQAVAAAPDIPAVVADAAALPVVDACCDLVVAYMSLQDVDDMPRAIREIARALEAGGHLCMAVVHPINSAGQFESSDSEAPFVIEGSYLDSHQYVDRIERDDLAMTFSSNHHSLETYFRALETAGLVVESIREVPVDEPSALDDPRRLRWRRLPLFLDLRAVKR